MSRNGALDGASVIVCASAPPWPILSFSGAPEPSGAGGYSTMTPSRNRSMSLNTNDRCHFYSTMNRGVSGLEWHRQSCLCSGERRDSWQLDRDRTARHADDTPRMLSVHFYSTMKINRNRYIFMKTKDGRALLFDNYFGGSAKPTHKKSRAALALQNPPTHSRMLRFEDRRVKRIPQCCAWD